MEERKEQCTPAEPCCEPEPREVVEVYRQRGPREVVLTYSRPLPRNARTQRGPAPAIAPAPARKRGKKGLWIFLILFSLALMTAAVGGILQLLQGEPEDFAPDRQHRQETEEPAAIDIPVFEGMRSAKLQVSRETGETLTPQEVYQTVNASVVTVLVERDDYLSVGTGVIFTEDGYIITNHHVLEGGTDCLVMLDTGYSFDAQYVAGDAGHDLAILKISAGGLPAADFGDSDSLSVGDKVYAIGNPLGVELRGTMTDGIVSATAREMWVDDRYMTLIQTNAALNSGNSGGPLINASGQVVGINVIKMTSRSASVEGLGFAIPTAVMERIINDLLRFGEIQPEPLLGLSVMTAAEEAAPGVWGLRVDSVTEGGAAEAAGVHAGDFVLEADGERLTSSADLLRQRRKLYVGDTMVLKLWRGGETLEVTLQLDQAVEEEEQLPPWYVTE